MEKMSKSTQSSADVFVSKMDGNGNGYELVNHSSGAYIIRIREDDIIVGRLWFYNLEAIDDFTKDIENFTRIGQAGGQ
jgi:hypothetical protein